MEDILDIEDNLVVVVGNLVEVDKVVEEGNLADNFVEEVDLVVDLVQGR